MVIKSGKPGSPSLGMLCKTLIPSFYIVGSDMPASGPLRLIRELRNQQSKRLPHSLIGKHFYLKYNLKFSAHEGANLGSVRREF
jgi:hypothetical protein